MKLTITLGAVAIALGSAPSLGNEPIPPTAVLTSTERTAVEAYRTKSKDSLDALTRMVKETALGRDDRADAWDEQCSKALEALIGLRQRGVVPASLDPWYSNELASWKNVRGIGGEMLVTHTRIITVLEELDQDVKDTKALRDGFESQAEKVNRKAEDLDRVVWALEKAADFSVVSDLTGPLLTTVGELGTNSKLLSKILVQLRKKKFDFIEERELQGEYRDALDKLKSKALDPNGSGNFYAREIAWEEEMYKSYRRYVDAVEDWHTAHKWLTSDEADALLRDLIDKGVEIASGSVVTIPIPGVLTADPEKLGDWCLEVRSSIRNILKIYGKNEWARLEHEISDCKDQRQEARAAFEAALRDLAESVTQRVREAKLERDTALASIRERQRRARDELERAGDDAALERRILDRLSDLAEDADLAERKFTKSERYIRNDWHNRLEHEHYLELREAVRRIDEEIRGFESQKPR